MIAPAFIFLMMLVVFAGKVAEANGNIERAASEAARSASLRQHPTDAKEDAEATALQNLTQAGVQCTTFSASVDTSDFRPGGTIRVTITCVASMKDVSLLGVANTRTFAATAVEVIDTYRSDP